MCDLNGPFRLCTCSSDIDYTKPHWILRMNSINDDVETMVTIGMMMPLNLINKIERRKILRRLNTVNVFDFEYAPSENDQLELNYGEDDGYTFNFKKGKWVFEEWYGEHQEFEYKNHKEGLIESENSKLKEVYKRYLNVLNEGEMDIVQGEWIVKRRNCVATLNNRGSAATKSQTKVWLVFYGIKPLGEKFTLSFVEMSPRWGAKVIQLMKIGWIFCLV